MSKDEESKSTSGESERLSRRGLLQFLGATGIGIGVGAAGVVGAQQLAAPSVISDPEKVVPFFGDKQAGITTAMQEHMYFVSLDLLERATRDDLIGLLKKWTAAAARMARGMEATEAGASGLSRQHPPEDSGEALDLPANSLTITFGFGPTLFVKDGVDRYGLAANKPKELKPLPGFMYDFIDHAKSHGDLGIQVCADDPQVALHAARNLIRMSFSVAQVRWTQLGFGRSSSTSHAQTTPRNLFGFKDGTANIMAEDTEALNKHVWVQPGTSADWMTGGTYLMLRKIRMTIETWDRTKLLEQEEIFGRSKIEGAPLSGGTEFTKVDFEAVNAGGEALIPMDAHVRLTHSSMNSGIRMLRRGYNYADGSNEYAQLDAGLVFIAFQKSPDDFATVQRSLSVDPLNEYIKHVATAVFAIPPGLKSESDFVGSGLFA